MPTQIIEGSRIGRAGHLRIGCSATLFDEKREKVLLTRRTDNGLWCLPGGGMDPGESIAETCLREFEEETGLSVRIVRLIGVYSSPDWLIVYPDGNKAQIVALNFEVESIGGNLEINQEVSEFGFFSLKDIDTIDLMKNHRQRIQDAFTSQKEPFIR